MPADPPLRSRAAKEAAESALVRIIHHYGDRPEFVVLGGLVPELLCADSMYQHTGTMDIDAQVNLEIAYGAANATRFEQALRNAEFVPGLSHCHSLGAELRNAFATRRSCNGSTQRKHADQHTKDRGGQADNAGNRQQLLLVAIGNLALNALKPGLVSRLVRVHSFLQDGELPCETLGRWPTVHPGNLCPCSGPIKGGTPAREPVASQ